MSSAAKKILCHTYTYEHTRKVLKIYLKFTAVHQFTVPVLFCKPTQTHIHARTILRFFWYSMVFSSVFFEENKTFHLVQNETQCCISIDGHDGMKKKAWKHITTSHNCIAQPYTFCIYLKFLFTWNYIFCVPVHVSVLFSAKFFFSFGCWGILLFDAKSFSFFSKGLIKWNEKKNKQTKCDRTCEIRASNEGFPLFISFLNSI